MIKKWKVLNKKEVFKKYSRCIEKVDFLMPNGSKSDFYLKKENPAVATLSITTENQIILVKQFRPGPDKILSELPGGYVKLDQNPLEAAQAELLEETGFSGDFEEVTECFDDAYSTMKRTIFVAKNCKKVQEQNLDKNEYAEVKLVSLEEFRQILRSGQMTDVEVGYLALDYLNLL